MKFCYDEGIFDANINQEHKYKIINTNGKRGFNVVRPTMPMPTDEMRIIPLYNKEYYRGQNQNIIEDITKYNY